MKVSIFLIISFLFVIYSCTQHIKLNTAKDGVQIVKKLPKDLECTIIGNVEVKDILESSAIEELKNSVEGLNGNYLIITKTTYKSTFVIHKARGYKCN